MFCLTSVPTRVIIVLLASMATTIQYTIRMNLSVTIIAMVNQSFVRPNELLFNESNTEVFINPVIKKTIFECPAVSSSFNESIKPEITAITNVNNQKFKVRIQCHKSFEYK